MTSHIPTPYDVWSRIHAVIKHYKIPLNRLAELSGIDLRRMYTISGRASTPTISEAVAIAKIFPQYTIWIIAGDEINLKIAQDVPAFITRCSESSEEDL